MRYQQTINRILTDTPCFPAPHTRESRAFYLKGKRQMNPKPNKLKFTVRLNGLRGIKRATKAIKKMTKSLEKLNKSAQEATASFDKMKAAIPVLVEVETGQEE